tara:strand:+ start:3221 stop:4396 length:1176 start_codon:yes stop_codon:yes gene_type:complete
MTTHNVGIQVKVPLRVVLSFILTIGFSSITISQSDLESSNFFRRYFENIFGKTKDPSEPKFINYPTIAYAPETSLEIGASSLFVYFAKQDLNNRLSELKSFAFFTLENQYGLWIDHSIYTDNNKWFFYGRARYQDFPLFYYGIGRDSSPNVQSVINGNYILFRERFLRETLPSLYFGLELDFQGLNKIKYINTTPNFTKPEVGARGSNNLGLGLGLLYDNIHNAMNPRDGIYSEWAFINYSTLVGSDFDFTYYITDNRLYLPVKKNTILATQIYGQFTSGNPPFNMLSLMGGESLMRGYYLGRYRDKHLVAGQVEYRILPFSFSKSIGASVFLAVGQVFGDDHKFKFNNFLPSGGAGLRFLIFPDKDIYTRLDLAFTEEGRGLYFFIGEAF